MMAINSLRDLIVYRKSLDLTCEICAHIKEFPNDELFSHHEKQTHCTLFAGFCLLLSN